MHRQLTDLVPANLETTNLKMSHIALIDIFQQVEVFKTGAVYHEMLPVARAPLSALST
jgi:hypothetical protein